MMPPMPQIMAASMRNWVTMLFALGADGPADADLPGALGDRHQHDVHDADAAHQQGDGGDAAQHQAACMVVCSLLLCCHWLLCLNIALAMFQSFWSTQTR